MNYINKLFLVILAGNMIAAGSRAAEPENPKSVELDQEKTVSFALDDIKGLLGRKDVDLTVYMKDGNFFKSVWISKITNKDKTKKQKPDPTQEAARNILGHEEDDEYQKKMPAYQDPEAPQVTLHVRYGRIAVLEEDIRCIKVNSMKSSTDKTWMILRNSDIVSGKLVKQDDKNVTIKVKGDEVVVPRDTIACSSIDNKFKPHPKPTNNEIYGYRGMVQNGIFQLGKREGYRPAGSSYSRWGREAMFTPASPKDLRIPDLYCLEGMLTAKELHLNKEYGLSSLKGLSVLKNVTTIRIDSPNHEVQLSFEGTEEAPSVKAVYAYGRDYGARISLKGIGGLINLEKLTLYSSSIKGIGDISTLKRLKTMELQDIVGAYSFTDIASPYLERLAVNRCAIKDFSFLKKLPNLKHLSVANNRAPIDLSLLAYTEDLEILELPSGFTNPSEITKLKKLKSLHLIGGGSQEKIPSLKNSPDFKTLVVWYGPINSLPCLQGIEEMDTIRLVGDLPSLSVLKGLKRINTLDLSGANIAALDIPDGLIEIGTLRLCSTTSDITSLLKLKKLGTIAYGRNRLNVTGKEEVLKRFKPQAIIPPEPRPL